MKTGSITATNAGTATLLRGSQPGPVVCRLHRPGGVAAARVGFILGGKIDGYRSSPGKGNVMSEIFARFEQWLQMQWARFNLWCDYKQRYPKEKITVTWIPGTDKFHVGRSRTARTPAQIQEMKADTQQENAKIQAERQRQEKLRALMTPEQRQVDDAKRQNQLDGK